MSAAERESADVPGARPAELDGVRRALAVVAHPDDESFGLGAVLSSLVDWGIDVDLLCFSQGEASTVGAQENLGRIRAAELTEAAGELRLGQVWLCGLPDGQLDRHRQELAEQLATRVDKTEALVVMEPSGVTGHPDHRAATAAAYEAATRLGMLCIEWGVAPAVATALSEEMGAPLRGFAGAGVREWPVNRARQRAAISRHKSQSPANPLLIRRLELQGSIECVRVRPAPFGDSTTAAVP